MYYVIMIPLHPSDYRSYVYGPFDLNAAETEFEERYDMWRWTGEYKIKIMKDVT